MLSYFCLEHLRHKDIIDDFFFRFNEGENNGNTISPTESCNVMSLSDITDDTVQLHPFIEDDASREVITVATDRSMSNADNST